MIKTIVWPDATQQGAPISKSQANIRAFLKVHKIELRRNEFSRRDEIIRDGRTLPLNDDTLRAIRLEADEAGLSPKNEYFNDVIFDLARRRAYHPVINYLNALEWDGKPRLHQLGPHYLGCEDTALIRAILPAFFVAAVRRIVRPGCKFDNLLILEGPQGAGKSSFCKMMAGEDWFSDSLTIGSDPKDTIEATAGKWICELAEMAGFSKRDRERVKAFLSRSTDSAALKYQRLASDVPRQFVLIATSNNDRYLTDVTGNRRFWSVKVGQIDLDAIRRDRDQFWAEAVHLDAEEYPVELPPSLWEAVHVEQQKRFADEPWLDAIEPVLDGKYGAVSTDSLWRFLNIEANRRDPHAGERLAGVMSRLGFERDRLRRRETGDRGEGKPTRCFVRPGWGNGTTPWIQLPGSNF